MTAREESDRAALALGIASLLSVLFAFVRGKFEFLQIDGGGIVVALLFGLLACAAGWLANRLLCLASGVGFLLAALVQLALMTQGSGGFLKGNGSTFSLWLGLGAGLLALALTPRTAAAPTD